MAIWKHIIADSGGSKTTWAFCSSDGTVRYLETPGLHPKVALNLPQQDWDDLRETLGNPAGETLYFYGAGCAQESTQQEMAALFRAIGFETVRVFPDTLGACRATCGKEPGIVAILGTGSILVEYDGTAIVNRIGGYGSIIGDEGSGFHFGRLVIRDYLNGASEMPEANRISVRAVTGTADDVLKQLASPVANQWIAQLGGQLSGLDLAVYHRKNLEQFVETYLAQIKSSSLTVNIVGSYGFYQEAILRDLLLKRKWKTGEVIRNPIQQLVEFHA